jgi:phage tail sheath protein FI
VFSLFAEFAKDRMDHIFIADPIRHILVTGNNTKTLSDSTKSWSEHVFSPLRHQFELANTSYAAAYANWARVNDAYSQTNVWVPFSGIVAADYARSDRNFAYWSAPAGFTRGLVQGVDDIAIAPNQKQRDDLYKFNLNPIAQFVREGIVIYGQKTMQRTPSAFDRVNVRRLFILLEKQTKAIARYYVFEPNSLYTRTRVVDDLTPIFEAAKANTVNQGIYDYLLICDDRNNPPSVIDANELVVDIYIKPVRTAEFILVNFHATRTSANFQEILR